MEFSTGDQLEYNKTHPTTRGTLYSVYFMGTIRKSRIVETMPIFITKSRRLYRKFQTMKNVIYKN